MLKIRKKANRTDASTATLTLNYELRARSRLRTTLDDGRDAAIDMERGTQLFPGDKLYSESGEIVEVLAARETLSLLHSDDPLLLARACYHLGNRHVALQISSNELRYQHDHVLDDMARLLGLEVEIRQARFKPESGAYGAHAHIHGHDH